MEGERDKILSTSKTDFLTGCLSKETIDSTLDRVRAECDIDKKPFSLAVLDLDHFKVYNDKYGHLDGDDILRYFASTVRINLKETENFIFRFGGDEFVIVFPGKGGKETFSIVYGLLKILRRRPFLSRGRIYNLNFSGGIASYPTDGHDIVEIIGKADKAMYFSKMHGRAKITLYRRIFWETIKRISRIIVAILLAAGLWFYFQNSPYKDYIGNWLKGNTSKIGTTLMPVPQPQVYTDKFDFVYLKSGRILKGVIVRDDEDEIDLDLSLEKGKGTITVKKSDIEHIKKRLQKLPET